MKQIEYVVFKGLDFCFQIIYNLYKLIPFIIFLYTFSRLLHGGIWNFVFFVTSIIAIYKYVNDGTKKDDYEEKLKHKIKSLYFKTADKKITIEYIEELFSEYCDINKIKEDYKLTKEFVKSGNKMFYK